VPLLVQSPAFVRTLLHRSQVGCRLGETTKCLDIRSFFWCCRTGLNCRPLPYQGSALPLSYGSKGRRVPRPRRAETATRGGRVQGKSPGDPAGRLGRPRHIAPTPLRRARMMRSARWSMVDGRCDGRTPSPACGGGWGGARGGATPSGRLKNLDIFHPKLTPASGAGGGLRPGSTPKAFSMPGDIGGFLLCMGLFLRKSFA
jgi:hypothetical protein